MPHRKLDRLWPVPREVETLPGVLRLPGGSVRIEGEAETNAAKVLAERLGSDGQADTVPLRLRLDSTADFANRLGPDQRHEAYRLEIGEADITLTSLKGCFAPRPHCSNSWTTTGRTWPFPGLSSPTSPFFAIDALPIGS